MIDALTTLGISLRAGDRWKFDSAETLAESLGVRPQYARFLDHLTKICEADGLLTREETGWRVVREPVTTDPRRLLARLRNEYPEWQAVFHLVERCGLSLARVLKGELSPLGLLFPDDPTASAERIYQDVPSARAANTLIAETIEAMLASLPPARAVRVLEIGAGTGGTTASLVARLPTQRVEYVFTDVSTIFLKRTARRFAGIRSCACELLDVEQDDVAAGDSTVISPGGFDLILAANVLHATCDLRKTLRNVRRLLAPGGMVVLLEGTAQRRGST